MFSLPLAAALCAVRPAWAQAPREKPQVASLFVLELSRPADAPPRGETVWDLFEQATYKFRKARVIRDETKAKAEMKSLSGEMDILGERLGRLETVHREMVWPGLHVLIEAKAELGIVGGHIDVNLQERELYASLAGPSGAYQGPIQRPSQESIRVLRDVREKAFRLSVQAEEILEKGAKRLRKAHSRKLTANYLADLIMEGEEDLIRSTEKALQAAKTIEELSRKPGPYEEAIAAAAAYGGADGTGPFQEEARDKAIVLSNEVNARFVAVEYQIASRLEEGRTLPYMLDRFGKL